MVRAWVIRVGEGFNLVMERREFEWSVVTLNDKNDTLTA